MGCSEIDVLRDRRVTSRILTQVTVGKSMFTEVGRGGDELTWAHAKHVTDICVYSPMNAVGYLIERIYQSIILGETQKEIPDGLEHKMKLSQLRKKLQDHTAKC